MSEHRIRIEPKGLRVEFDGSCGPTRLVVPVVFPVGKHRDVCVRVCPRQNVVLRNEVEIGDALQVTFSRSHTTSGGASFFASASHGRTFGATYKPYDVVSLPDFRGIRFRMSYFEVCDEPIGLQLAFPIERCDQETDQDFFAQVTLEVNSKVQDSVCLEREVHPAAGKILLLNGYSEEFAKGVYGALPQSSLDQMRRPFIQFSQLTSFNLDNLQALATANYDGIHLYTNINGETILIDDAEIHPNEFFIRLNGLGLKFIYIDTCNSVRVVSSFRRTDIRALIAATENLYVPYADKFELAFYEALGAGKFASEAFQKATVAGKEVSSFGFTRSGDYDPMFLDLKNDFRFGSDTANNTAA